MRQFNILAAKTQFSRLVDDVETGREKEIIIARAGRPVARLVPLDAKPKKKIRLGLAAGNVEVPENIDRDNDLILKLFLGETV